MRFSQLFISLRCACTMLLAGTASLAQDSPSFAVDRSSLNLVRVTITVHGLQLSQARVRPGRVQFFIENQTPLPAPELVISSTRLQGAVESRSPLTKLDGRRAGARIWREANLPVGTYILSLANAPEVQGRITVIP